VLQTFVRIFDWLAEKAEKLRQLVGHVECQVVYLRGFWPSAAKLVQLLFACHAKTRIVWLAVVRPGCRAKHSAVLSSQPGRYEVSIAIGLAQSYVDISPLHSTFKVEHTGSFMACCSRVMYIVHRLRRLLAFACC
jgi:hypothetical protein